MNRVAFARLLRNIKLGSIRRALSSVVERSLDMGKVIGSIPVGRTESFGVRSSVVERCPDKTEVDGSIPSAPTAHHGNQNFI